MRENLSNVIAAHVQRRTNTRLKEVNKKRARSTAEMGEVITAELGKSATYCTSTVRSKVISESTIDRR